MNDSYKELLVSKRTGGKGQADQSSEYHSYRTGRSAGTFDR